MTTDVQDARALPEEGFHEIQLSGKQLVFLFMATTVVSVVIFLCGVLVGRGVRDDSSSLALLSPLAEEATAEAVEVADPPPLAAENATPPEPAESGSPDAGSVYYDALMKDKPPSESLEAAKPAPAEVTPEVSLPATASAAAEPSAASASTAVASAPAPIASVPQAPSDGWVVQVSALRQRQEAQAIASRLAGRGYKAFVMDPQSGAPAYYRVRVGPFGDRADAERTAKRLADEEQFKPFISR
ncbi:MAG: SPOR domain-containing protein [Vicinamibacterales bacterium]